MPHRLDEHRAKIQFVTFALMPSMIYKACLKTGTVSNTVYIQRAVCRALAKDLKIPLSDLLALLPAPRGAAMTLFDPSDHPMARRNPGRIGPGNTIEDVR